MSEEELMVVLKALADSKRIKIIELLSKGSLCACELLEHFDFTQPTLSHHMKILAKAELVIVEKKGQWHHYQLKNEQAAVFLADINKLFNQSIDGSKENNVCIRNK